MGMELPVMHHCSNLGHQLNQRASSFVQQSTNQRHVIADQITLSVHLLVDPVIWT